MIKLIVGNKGTGKTKALIEMVHAAVATTNGNVICIEKGAKLTYDLQHEVRLIDAEHYAITGYDAFYGFIAGLCAGNYDITEIYVDSILKIGGPNLDELAAFLSKIDELTKDVKIVFTVSADTASLPEGVKRFMD